MDFTDVLLLVIRWFHALAAVAWVGGGLYYLLILRPSLKTAGEDGAVDVRMLGEQFRGLVNTAIAVLLVTGIVLTVSRLTTDYVGVPYVAVLGVKIGMAIYMFYLVRFLRPRTYPEEPAPDNRGLQRLAALFTGARAVLLLGVIVFLLADILQALVEQGIGE